MTDSKAGGQEDSKVGRQEGGRSEGGKVERSKSHEGGTVRRSAGGGCGGGCGEVGCRAPRIFARHLSVGVGGGCASVRPGRLSRPCRRDFAGRPLARVLGGALPSRPAHRRRSNR